MNKITFHSATKLSTITDKPTKIVFDEHAEIVSDVTTKIDEYVHKHYPNAYNM